MRAQLLTSLLLPYLGFAIGCGASAGGGVKKLDPPAATATAMEIYDRNSDGKLADDELKNSPALSASGRRIDQNGDGLITREELQARLEAIEAGADFIALDVVVTSKGRPLVGAEVTLTPEPFMGEGRPSFSGTTVEGGGCPLQATEGQPPGVPSGFYEAKIVHSGQGINTVRGVEISDDASGNRLQLAL